MNIKSKEIKLVNIKDIKINPKNRNNHPKDQIDRLVKIIKENGFRNPLTISNQSGFLVAGHGRLQAAKELKIKELPVMFQDFENQAMEYAHMTADNAIQSWSTLDFSEINNDIGDFGPELDIELLGLKNFGVDVNDFDEPSEKPQPKHKEADIKACPNCGCLVG